MNVNIDAKNMGDALKNIPYRAILFLVSLIAGLLVFLPDALLRQLFLLDFRNRIGTFLGIVFVFSFCTTLYLFVKPMICDFRINKELSGEKAKNKIKNLSIEEKKILFYMYRHQAESIALPRGSSAVVHLKSLIMISEASNIGQQLGNVQFYTYFLQQWVIRTLENNPEIWQDFPDRLPKIIERYRDYVDF